METRVVMGARDVIGARVVMGQGLQWGNGGARLSGSILSPL